MVGIRNVSLGDYVKDGTDLVNIEDVRTLKEVDFSVPRAFLTKIRKSRRSPSMSSSCRCRARRWRWPIDAINPTIGMLATNHSSICARDFRDTSGKLRPGMFVRVRVILGEGTMLAVVRGGDRAPGRRVFCSSVIDREGQTVVHG